MLCIRAWGMGGGVGRRLLLGGMRRGEGGEGVLVEGGEWRARM